MPPIKLSLMSATPTTVHTERCLWQRHQGAACKYCLEACPTGALQFFQRAVQLNEDRCLGCGVCLSTCPVECFGTEDWSERSLINTLQQLERPAVEVACQPHPSPQAGSEAVPVLQIGVCLGAISPGLWFEIGLEYSVRIRLEVCADCPVSRLAFYARQAVELANSWLQSCGHEASLTIQETNPEKLAANQRVVISAERPILNRRDFFFAFARSSGTPTQALVCLPAEKADEANPDKSPPHQPAWLRRLADIYPGPTAVEDALTESTGEPRQKDGYECALWPTLEVAQNCAACGACARYCPSGALSTRVVDGKFTHFFTPGVCVACGLCAQVCRSGALTRSYAPELNPFEEQVMAERLIGNCRKCGSPALDALSGLCYWCANEPPMRSLMDNARNFLIGKR